MLEYRVVSSGAEPEIPFGLLQSITPSGGVFDVFSICSILGMRLWTAFLSALVFPG